MMNISYKSKFSYCDKFIDNKEQLFESLRPSDNVYLKSLSVLGRTTQEVFENVRELIERGCEVVSIKEDLDTSTETGKAKLQMMMDIAKLEQELAVQRVRDGQKASKGRGKHIGRPKVDSDKLKTALRMYETGEHSVREITHATGISQGTLYKAINERKAQTLSNPSNT